MSSIQDFVKKDIFSPRMKKNGILVVYDPEARYRELCNELNDEDIRVIDASESSIISRESAIQALSALGLKTIKGMVVYVPARKPVTEEEQQRDPFSLYIACGAVFPDGDGDSFLSICLKAKPDHGTEVRRIFGENPNPDFAVINAVGGGNGWPTLQTLLKVESARDILMALLAPTVDQQNALKGQAGWVAEAKELFRNSLDMKLLTKAKSWSPIADELWRYVLYSEFVFDLPDGLPDSLHQVPCANPEARPLIEYLCDALRNDQRTQHEYLSRATTVEQELALASHCQHVNNMGSRDTFAFEERWYLDRAIEYLRSDNLDEVRNIIKGRESSVWKRTGESQVQWGLLQATLDLVQACADNQVQISEHSQNMTALIDYYVSILRDVDRMHREFEQAAGDYLETRPKLSELIDLGRAKYRMLMEQVHDLFIRHFETTGWPVLGKLYNANIFDQFVAPRLTDKGNRVGFFMVDALRYELGVALANELSEDGKTELYAALAPSPSVTKVGMASLLPRAGDELVIKCKDDGSSVPYLGDIALGTVAHRMNVLNSQYGQRFQEMKLNDFLGKKTKIAKDVDLLVLRSGEIDSQFESNPETAPGLILDMLKRIRVAVHRLKTLGFNDIVIATDHGFVFNMFFQAGDFISKPPGNWTNEHERLLLGQGSGDAANFMMPAEKAGIRGDYAWIAGPRGLIPYRSGMAYFHGGASLQELIVPLIIIRLEKEREDYRTPEVTISYKNGAKKVTTRLPVLDVTLEGLGLFGQEGDLEILLEAHDSKGNVVGEAKSGGRVNPATGTITLIPGERIQVPIKMQPEYEGKFTVKALNPTTLTIYCKVDLETDYVV